MRAREVSTGAVVPLDAPSIESVRVKSLARTRTVGLVIFRIGLIALVMIAQAILSALAFASPADPSWIPGIYDDADYDDVVALVMSATGNVAPVVPAVLRSGPPLIRCLLDCSETAALVRSASALRPRAPPAA